MSQQHATFMDTSGKVQTAVAAVKRRLIGASSGGYRMNMSGSLTPRVRRGTAEQGAQSRHRSRGRKNGSVRSISGRSQPAGPQEEHDWIQALEATTDRIDTFERLQRMSAQTTNHFDESLRGFKSRLADACSDITDFRNSVATAESNLD